MRFPIAAFIVLPQKFMEIKKVELDSGKGGSCFDLAKYGNVRKPLTGLLDHVFYNDNNL